MTCLALLIALTASAESKPVVSVLYFENRGGGPEVDVLRKGFAEMIITDLVAWDGVTVVERGRLEDVLKEQKLQSTKAFDKSTAVKVGKLVGAQYAITGTLVVSGGQLRVDANVTSVDKGDVVASATAKDAQDKVFDIEQQLMDSLTQAIDWKLKNKDARKKAKVPSFDALVAYSKAIDLSDQGKVDEAQKAMAAVVSKSPTFLMARERKQELLEKLKEFEARKKDIVTGAALEVGKRADQELEKSFDALPIDGKKQFLFWRAAKGRFLARVLKQHLSSRAETLRVIRVGQEGKALEVMKGWAENQRRFIDEATTLSKLDRGSSFDAQRTAFWELIRDSGLFADGASPGFEVERLVDTLGDFIIQGRVTDGVGYSVAPPLGVLVPEEEKRALEALAQEIARAEAAYNRASDKRAAEYALGRACMNHGEALEWLRRDDDAAAAYQKLLDVLPTSDQARRAEEKIQVIIGAKHDSTRSDREKYEKAIRDCEDFYVNPEIGWRLRRKGLAGLDEIAADMEKACFGRPDLTYQWDRFYTALASDAARHEDCDRARRYYVKAYVYGNMGPSSLEPLTKDEPWCRYAFELPTKVRVDKASFGTRGNPIAEGLSEGIAELVAEELAARGVPVQTGGSYIGGVAGMYVALEPKAEKGDDVKLQARLNTDGNDKQVELSVPTKGSIDFDAFFAPALKVLQGRVDPGPRKPTSKMPLEQAMAFGKAMALYDGRKFKEATEAFEALKKKYPNMRLAAVRAQMAAAKAKKDD